MIALTILGLFDAIYHPFGNSWVVQYENWPGEAIVSAGNRGLLGVAVGSAVAGVLTDLIDWHAAFILQASA